MICFVVSVGEDRYSYIQIFGVRFRKPHYRMTIIHSKDKKYTADINLEMNKSGRRTLYKPKLLLAVPGKELVNIYGTIDYEKRRKIILYDIMLDKVFKKPIKLKGRKFTSLHFKSFL